MRQNLEELSATQEEMSRKEQEYLKQIAALSERLTQASSNGQWDIAQAAQKIAQRVQSGSLQPQDITPELIDRNISISDLPRPDLCIRTGGDARISNFMLWHFAYTELYFTDTLWPDFTESEFARALAEYSRRERRFGLRDPDGLVTGGTVDA